MTALNRIEKSDEYIDRLPHLPPAPTIATKLLGMFSDPNRDIDVIVELITHDPSLTVEVLKRCNSGLLGRNRPVSDMFEAVTRLGFYEVYCVVAALVGARAMAVGSGTGGVDTAALWRHSVTAAVAAEIIARQVGEPEPVAFTAALLHDIGKLILGSVESSAYGEVLKQAASGSALAAAEQATFGVTHASVGAQLMARWRLPGNVVVAVLHHHGSPQAAAPFSSLAATIGLANQVAHYISDGANGAPDLLTANPESLEILRLKPEELPKLIAQTQTGMQRVQGLLQLAG